MIKSDWFTLAVLVPIFSPTYHWGWIPFPCDLLICLWFGIQDRTSIYLLLVFKACAASPLWSLRSLLMKQLQTHQLKAHTKLWFFGVWSSSRTIYFAKVIGCNMGEKSPFVNVVRRSFLFKWYRRRLLGHLRSGLDEVFPGWLASWWGHTTSVAKSFDLHNAHVSGRCRDQAPQSKSKSFCWKNHAHICVQIHFTMSINQTMPESP